MSPKFHPGQLVSGPGFAWFYVEKVNEGPEGYVYELREHLSETLAAMDRAAPKRGVAEKYIRNVLFNHNRPQFMSEHQKEVYDHLHGRKMDLLAMGLDRLDEEGDRPEVVIADTEVQVGGLTLLVRVELNSSTGEILRYWAV